jgi:hypothetical protein
MGYGETETESAGRGRVLCVYRPAPAMNEGKQGGAVYIFLAWGGEEEFQHIKIHNPSVFYYIFWSSFYFLLLYVHSIVTQPISYAYAAYGYVGYSLLFKSSWPASASAVGLLFPFAGLHKKNTIQNSYYFAPAPIRTAQPRPHCLPATISCRARRCIPHY